MEKVCNLFGINGCADSDDTCKDTSFNMIIGIGKSVAKIVALIALPGAGIVAKFLEFGL